MDYDGGKRERERRYILGQLLAFSYDTRARKRNDSGKDMKLINICKMSVVNPLAKLPPQLAEHRETHKDV